MTHFKTALFAIALAALSPCADAATPTWTDLYDFKPTGPGGDTPIVGLTADPQANVYGMTPSEGGPYKGGAVFSYSNAGKFTALHDFTEEGCDVGGETAPLSRDASGNLYGAVYFGNTHCLNGGIWRLAPDGSFTVLHKFSGGKDGANPSGPLVFDSSGNAYGAAAFGGQGSQGGNGLIYKITPGGTESIVYTFSGPDGANPVGVLIDSAGNLIGASKTGGAAEYGTIFRIDLGTGAETVLYSFTNNGMGIYPYGPPVEDSIGNIYGTNSAGGTRDDLAVYRLTPGGMASIVFKATEKKGGPLEAGLTVDKGNNIFAVIESGERGSSNLFGSIYRITPDGHARLYYALGEGAQDYHPNAPLVITHDGTIYGTTITGGAEDGGAIFKLAK